MFTVPKISLGSAAHKRYTHDMSFDNNTTFDFGSVQPLFSQLMFKNDKLSVGMKQLVRLAPMPVPSFARVRLVNEFVFVPITDVCPFFDCMLAQMPYSVGTSNYYPKQVPVIANSTLLCLLLGVHASYSVYMKHADGYSILQTQFSSTWDKSFKQAVFHTSSTSFVAGGALIASNFTAAEGFVVKPDGADYVVNTGDSAGSLTICFRLTNTGRRLRKIFIGLGYSLDANNDKVSFLPLLAFYKAWFDLYSPQRLKTWTSSKCFALIKYVESNYYVDFTPPKVNGSSSTASDLFFDFMKELVDCWYVTPDDFLSIHRTSMQLSHSQAVYFRGNTSWNDGVPPKELLASASSGSDIFSPILPPSTGNSLTLIDLQLLQRLTRYVNKDSIIGRKLSTWLKVHYGSNVANSVFKDSYHIGTSVVPLDINDVFSTSDTAQGTGDSATGEKLGAYGGKGLGFGKDGFKFTADQPGFVFILSSIVPTASYFTGNDPSLYACDLFTFPNPDYDALGFEVTPRSAIESHNDIVTMDDPSNKGFGFIPRYSGFKVKRNIVNGDMSRRGTIASMSPYYLDRILTSRTLRVTAQNGSHFTLDLKNVPLPSASLEWRYVCKYPWLGNYNRLFYADSDFAYTGSTAAEYTDVNHQDDNFICQSLFDVKLTNFLKPLSQSFDTYDDNDNTSFDVKAE